MLAAISFVYVNAKLHFPCCLVPWRGVVFLGALGEQLFERKMAEKDLEVGQDGYVSWFIKPDASSLL